MEEWINEILNDIQPEPNNEIDDRIDSFIDRVYSKASLNYTINYYSSIRRETLKDMLTHEIMYILSLQKSQIQAENILKELTDTQIERLIYTIQYEVMNKGIDAVDYKTTKFPYILANIFEIMSETKPRRGKKYCPNCGNPTSIKKSRCEHCKTYLTTQKISKRIFNSIKNKLDQLAKIASGESEND